MEHFDRYLRIQIVSAEPEKLLTKLSFSNVMLLDIQQIDLLTVEIKINERRLSEVRNILEKNGASWKIIKREGIQWYILNAARRPVLLFGVILYLVAAFLLPGRIYFVEVTGNEQIPDIMILEEAENCGIHFGVKASTVRSEEVKNSLLGKLPQLQWIGITTEGSVATIQVVERSEPESTSDSDNPVSSIVAARDGMITQMTVYKGNPLFQVGQTVKMGDVIVSGYTDCGIKLKAECAQAEVFAHTRREISIVSPSPTLVRSNLTDRHTCYRLRIGKKVINLCNHSGIQDTTCVKMYSEDYWTLPGGFRLPLSFIQVDHYFYEPNDTHSGREVSYSWMAGFARSYLHDQMVSGQILNENLHWNLSEEGCVLLGEFSCHEMIGQVKYEEIIEQNAEDN